MLKSQIKRAEDPSVYGDFSIPVDFFLSLPSEKLEALVAGIAAEIEQSEERNERAKDVHKKFLHSIHIIVLNLLYIRYRCPDALLGIPLNNNDIQPKDRYSCRHISVNTYKDAYDGLLSCDYLTIALEPIIGDHTKKGRRTRIVATDKMNKLLDQSFGNDFLVFERTHDEETIRLKDKNKKLIDYQDTAFSNRARGNLEIINKNLQRFWYDIWITDAELRALATRLRQKDFPELADQNDEDEKSMLIDLTARGLYRVFNNSDFGQGGRFYGGWWQQIPRDMRKYITIDTKQTVELDFANLHPWILYLYCTRHELKLTEATRLKTKPKN